MIRVRAPRPPRAAHGASLIEVLVAVLVLSIGMLGLAALQARSLQGNASSLQRTQGVLLSQHVLDLLRADRTGVRAGLYHTGESRKCAASEITFARNADGTAEIAGAEIAVARLRDWLGALKTHMGRPDDTTTCARIRCDKDTAICDIDIFWDDSRAGGLAAQNLAVSSRL